MQKYDTLDQLLQMAPKTDIIWFIGKEKEGQSWCSDCDRTKYKVLDALNGHDYIKIEIEKVDLRNPNNEFRLDPKIQLKCVPTLLRFSTLERLEENECGDLQKLKQFVKYSDK